MRRVLIVEDDFFIRDLYKQSFINAGFDVEVSQDGNEALNFIKNKKFDFILLDLMLPNLNGIDTLKIIRSMNSNNEKTPVFVMTNLDEGNVTSEALKSGADKCFLKAKFTPKQIVEEVEYFLKKPSGDSLSDK